MKNKNEKIESGNNRREFLKTTALLGGGAVVLSQFSWAQNLIAKANTGSLMPEEASQL